MPKLLRTRSNVQQPLTTSLSLESHSPTSSSVTSTHRKVSEEDIQSSHNSSIGQESSDSFERASCKPQSTLCSMKRRAQSVCLVDLVPNDPEEEEPVSRRRVVSPILTLFRTDGGASSPTGWGLFALGEMSDTEGDEEWDWSTSAHATSFLPHTNLFYSPRNSPHSLHHHPYQLRKADKRRCIRSLSAASPLEGFILQFPPVGVEETTAQLSALGL
jgi:hypothetical protein